MKRNCVDMPNMEDYQCKQQNKKQAVEGININSLTAEYQPQLEPTINKCEDPDVIFIFNQTGANISTILCAVNTSGAFVGDKSLCIAKIILQINSSSCSLYPSYDQAWFYNLADKTMGMIANQYVLYCLNNYCECTYGKVDERDIALVADQARNYDRNLLIRTLKSNNLDIVNAIMELTM